ncbi:MAG: hypothetical protein PHC63_08345 [Candidatus Bathyarchaeota archaeon]|nr:hypothetical protein [Candidatus Bathyarchaeota archaeon]
MSTEKAADHAPLLYPNEGLRFKSKKFLLGLLGLWGGKEKMNLRRTCYLMIRTQSPLSPLFSTAFFD